VVDVLLGVSLSLFVFVWISCVYYGSYNNYNASMLFVYVVVGVRLKLLVHIQLSLGVRLMSVIMSL
jgi:hypothetical protein